MIVTSSQDYTCKIFENMELFSEIYIPKKQVLAIEVFKNLIAAGLSDGKIRFFDFYKNKVYFF